MKRIGALLQLAFFLLVAACEQPWNNPYPKSQARANIRYNSFVAPPKTLDPARSYSEEEIIFIAQIYEPPLQYHFLKRPYTLMPLTATKLPKVTYLDAKKKLLVKNFSQEEIAFTVYDIELKPGIYYQPHPAFAKNRQGQYLYHHLQAKDYRHIRRLSDFKQLGTRELIAQDYVYEIKRLAEPGINSPIYGLMSTKIADLKEYAQRLKDIMTQKNAWLDLRQYPLAGAQVVDKYHYKIILKGKYEQFKYWLAMTFFVPIPWEADAFYSQPGLIRRNITFDWYPVGTGPYKLIENNPNRVMVLTKNPLFHPEYYPTLGTKEDKMAGYLVDAGKRLPFIDTAIFTLEKEAIPRWNKFLQGYYDQSLISSDSFDQAIQLNSEGQAGLTPSLKKKGIYLQTSVTQSITYIGFNMLDEVVGGNSERARKLRLAISIAVNFQEYINIFLNGRGIVAQGPLPPTVFGYAKGAGGINLFVYEWKNGRPVLKSLQIAHHLMAEAGYPDGVDPKTGQPLILNYDLAATSGPEEKPLLDWLRQQFAKIGIQLNIRDTEYNRFQEKMRLGQAQIFIWAWIADYPDPENFLFLLYGPNSKVLHGGENASNYQNKAFDLLYDQMKNMDNNAARVQIINQMVALLRHDAPWIWGVYQENFFLNHIWDYPTKPNTMASNTLKYQRLDPILRYKLRHAWNHAVLWPIGIVLGLLLLISLPVFIRYRQKERQSVKLPKG